MTRELSRQNQHFVPKWLLRRFASSARAGEAKVWCHEKERSFQTSVRNIGSEGNFYGAPGSNGGAVETILSEHDSAHAALVARILENGISPARDRGELGVLFADLSIRTRNLRAGFVEAAEGAADWALERIRKLDGPALVEAALEQKPELRELLDSLPTQVRQHLVESAPRAVNPLLEEAMARAVAKLPETAREGHGAALEEGILKRSKWLEAMEWMLLPAGSVPFVLGDVGVVSYRFEIGQFAPGSAPGERPEPMALFLPIGPDRALAAFSSNLESTRVESFVPFLNRAAARNSERFFVSIASGPEEESLKGELGADWKRWRGHFE